MTKEFVVNIEYPSLDRKINGTRTLKVFGSATKCEEGGYSFEIIDVHTGVTNVMPLLEWLYGSINEVAPIYNAVVEHIESGLFTEEIV